MQFNSHSDKEFFFRQSDEQNKDRPVHLRFLEDSLPNFKSVSPAEPSAQALELDESIPFKPTSKDVEKFLAGRFIFSELQRKDLQDVADEAYSKGDVRGGKFASYVSEHFDDFRDLSQAGLFGIARSELELYGKLRGAQESIQNSGGSANADLRKVHEEHELGQSIIPKATVGLALLGGKFALKPIATLPAVNEFGMAFKAANPRAYFASLVGVVATTFVGAYYGGGKVGDYANRLVNTDGINKHFHDEAAPAMKRLFETK